MGTAGQDCTPSTSRRQSDGQDTSHIWPSADRWLYAWASFIQQWSQRPRERSCQDSAESEKTLPTLCWQT